MAYEVHNSPILSSPRAGETAAPPEVHGSLEQQPVTAASQPTAALPAAAKQQHTSSRARYIIEAVGAGLLLSAIIFSLVRRLQEETRLV